MTTTLTLTPFVENCTRELIESGRFPNADAVIDLAPQMLDEHEQARFLKLRELVLASRDSGNHRELTPEPWLECDEIIFARVLHVNEDATGRVHQ